MKKILFLLLVLFFLLKVSPGQAYYPQLTQEQIKEAIRLGQLYRGNINILFNNLMFSPEKQNRVALQFFTPFAQLVFLAAANPNLDEETIQQVIRDPKVYLLVYGDIKPSEGGKNYQPDNVLEVAGDFFNRDVYGNSGLTGKVGEQIYLEILRAGLAPYQSGTFPAREILPDDQIYYYLPAQSAEENNSLARWRPEKISLDFSQLE
jgi:hypothetical protein